MANPITNVTSSTAPKRPMPAEENDRRMTTVGLVLLILLALVVLMMRHLTGN
ncbi:MAG TPA: hypothetical protein VHC69_03715 [Polyangiaceae bacterium]|nr:hypothetical protein [Polyangiaceae bacterium]